MLIGLLTKNNFEV